MISTTRQKAGFVSRSWIGAPPKKVMAVCLPVCVLGLALSVKAQPSKGTIISIDVPGAGTEANQGQGTFAFHVNNQGLTVGWYTDASNVTHGFLRARDGHITTFDADVTAQSTAANSVNNNGVISGVFQDVSSVSHGFLRSGDGTITPFDAPGAGTDGNQGQGTFGEGINPVGAINGYYTDANNVSHGFLRTPDGALTEFDAPGAGTGANQGTFSGDKGINPKGEIEGWYIDGSNVYHGFLRTLDGAITPFDPPGGPGAHALGINPAGAITGSYGDVGSGVHGFLRAPDDTFTTFDAPGAAIPGTFANSLNPSQAIIGYYFDAKGVAHGFLRAPDGTFTSFDAPLVGGQPVQFTVPNFINAAGMIVGFSFDNNGLAHGFLRTP